MNNLTSLLTRDEFMPKFITEDARNRRLMYVNDFKRKQDEEASRLPQTEFLKSLNMVMDIKLAQEEDLKRAEELTIRTHQLNTTGYTYSYNELLTLLQSPQHKLIIVGLKDKYGEYGKIGLSLIEKQKESWTIKLLLMSCRVTNRGIGSALLIKILEQAKQADVKLRAEFVKTPVNRLMYITYRLLGFKEIKVYKNKSILEHDLMKIPSLPNYITTNNFLLI